MALARRRPWHLPCCSLICKDPRLQGLNDGKMEGVKALRVLEFLVYMLGFRVWSLEFRVFGLEIKISGSRIWGFKFMFSREILTCFKVSLAGL